jgi:FKBP-type peptidyl-prolyl cis-trans isomerase
MKKQLCVIVVFLGVVSFAAAEGIAEEARKGNEKADMSYAFGMVVAADLMETGLEFNYNSFLRGFREAMDKEKTRYTMDEAMAKIQAAYSAAVEEKAEQNLALGNAFLSENSKRPGVIVTSSGLHYEAVSEGTGDKPGLADTVLVHYRGATIDGTVFDTTYDSGEPMEIPLDRVIPGWSEGLRMMREGGKARLCIPPDLAYGKRGAGGSIGPNAVLVFDIELLEIMRSPEEQALPEQTPEDEITRDGG